MTPALATRLLIALSICYGIVVAILGALGSSAVGIVAMIGALVIGGLWAIRGVIFSRGTSR
jgi:hypothetical protein